MTEYILNYCLEIGVHYTNQFFKFPILTINKLILFFCNFDKTLLRSFLLEPNCDHEPKQNDNNERSPIYKFAVDLAGPA